VPRLAPVNKGTDRNTVPREAPVSTGSAHSSATFSPCQYETLAAAQCHV
jgi:hypothetical protein